jgi:hypothetical protein
MTNVNLIPTTNMSYQLSYHLHPISRSELNLSFIHLHLQLKAFPVHHMPIAIPPLLTNKTLAASVLGVIARAWHTVTCMCG